MRKNDMEIITARNLEKIYDDNGVPVQALRSVSVAFHKGEFTVIAGPSGSGKTTLLNLLGALDRPTSGEVSIEGTNVADLSNRDRAMLRLNKLGFIFQAYNLIPVLSALENIEFTMMLLQIPDKEREDRSMRVMDELGIAGLAHKRPNEMSGGQQQRVAVARAIVTNPAVVLADEPTANLDSATGASLLDLMERMNREKNITFIFSSHDPQVIERGRRLIMLHDGKVATDSRNQPHEHAT